MSANLSPSLWVLIPAAGRASRMGLATPKPFLELNGKLIIEYSIELFHRDPRVKQIVIMAEPSELLDRLCQKYSKLTIISGGAERKDSVMNGVSYVLQQDDTAWVAVHDAARPCLHFDDWQHLVERSFNRSVSAILASPVVDTIKQVDGSHVIKTVDRATLVRALTPQVTSAKTLYQALINADGLQQVVTDEGQALELIGESLEYVLAKHDNLKVTYPSDLQLVEQVLQLRESGNGK